MQKLFFLTVLLSPAQTILGNKLLEAAQQYNLEEVESILDQKSCSEDERFQALSHVNYALGYSKVKLRWHQNYKAQLNTLTGSCLLVPFCYALYAARTVRKDNPPKDGALLLTGTVLSVIPAFLGIDRLLKAFKSFTKPPYSTQYVLNLALKGLLVRC